MSVIYDVDGALRDHCEVLTNEGFFQTGYMTLNDGRPACCGQYEMGVPGVYAFVSSVVWYVGIAGGASQTVSLPTPTQISRTEPFTKSCVGTSNGVARLIFGPARCLQRRPVAVERCALCTCLSRLDPRFTAPLE